MRDVIYTNYRYHILQSRDAFDIKATTWLSCLHSIATFESEMYVDFFCSYSFDAKLPLELERLFPESLGRGVAVLEALSSTGINCRRML